MRFSLPILLAALAAAGLTGGCTRPAVALNPPGFQKEAYALRDWEDVAQHIANDMQHDGFLPNPIQPNAPPPRWAYYVNVTTPHSQFLREVADSLKGDILARGGAVSSTPFNAAEIDLNVDVVRWPARHRAPDGVATAAGLASGTGVLVANADPITPAGAFGVLAGAGIAADLIREMVPNTDTEVAWGASITMGNRVVFDVRYPMYIGDDDVALYHQTPPWPVQVVQLHYAP